MELAHTKTVEEILQEYKVTEEEGLNSSRVQEQRRKHGLNGKIVDNDGISLVTCPLSMASNTLHHTHLRVHGQHSVAP